MEKLLRIDYLLLLLYVILVTINAQTVQDYYTGAVVEYAPKYDDKETAGKNIQLNIDEYEKKIKEAKGKGADIILFPEYGLTTTKFHYDLHRYTTVLPDPQKKIVVCGYNSTNWSTVIQRLSCAAKNNTIYVVVNLPERVTLESSEDAQDKKMQIFNTNIVFDRTGALIARYRKYNLFSEAKFNVTETPDLTYFKTDFNVTFGTFTCFDILFAEPSLKLLEKSESVTDILFPTAWHSELPFLTAVQTQVGWARANGVNFLGAGYCDPKNTDGGSVIYQATGDVTYHIPTENKTDLIIKKIKKINKRASPKSVDRNTAKATNNAIVSNSNLKLETWKENMSNYNTVLLNETVTDYKMCHKLDESLCCTFTVQFDKQTSVDYYYRMIVYYGPRGFSTSTHNVQICGLAACTNKSSDSCGERIESPSNPQIFKEISIQGKFLDQGSSVIFPTNVLYDLGVLAPSNFTFKTFKSEETDFYRQVNMTTTQQIKDVLGFGIYSVTKDSPSQGGTKGLSGGVIAVIVIAVLIAVALVGLLIWRRFRNGNYKPAMDN